MTVPRAGYILSPLVAAAVTLVLVALVVQAGPRDRVSRTFLLVLTSLALWAGFTVAMRSSTTVEAALVFNRLTSAAILGLIATYFHFCHLAVGGRSRWPVGLLYAFCGASVPVILFTPLAVRGVYRAVYGYAPEVGPAGIALFSIVLLLMGLAVLRLLRARARAGSREDRRRCLLLAVAALLPVGGIVADGFTTLPPVAIWTNLAFSALCTVAILRYRLIDLRVLARRGVIDLLVGTLIAVPYVSAILAADEAFGGRAAPWIFGGALAVFALMVRPATEWARRRVDRLFSRVHLDHMEQLRNLTRGSSAAADPHIGRGLTALVQRALSGSSASLLEPHGEDDDLAVVARDGAVVQPPRRVLSADSPAVRWLRSRRTILSVQSLLAEPRLQETPQAEKAALAELGAALLVPLLTPRDELSGVLVLGPKANGRPYALDDRELLESLGREAAMALENARLFRDAARARETLQAWLHSLPDAVMIVDRDGIVRFLNKEGAARFGQRAGQRTFLSGGSLSEREVGRFSETIRGREHEIAFAPLVDPDGHVSTVYVLRDVTGRREEKAQRDLLETRARMASHLASIGEMASGIAHEINNPLTAVIGYSRLLRDQPLPEEARESVQGIVEGATRVAGIVQRLLTFARQKKPTRKKVDLNEVIRSTLELRAYALRTGSISVSTRLDPSLPATMADAQQMQQVLLNLIINAETAMKSVRPRGELLLMSGGDERRIHIMVKDDGPGVPREIQDRIFDPFFTTQEEGKGTGLGLSICHGIVSEHGGRIWVRSTPGEGAEFHVEIPVTGGGEEAAERVRAPVPSARPSRILVVDDEQAVRELLCKILHGAGHQVDAAPDGTSALEMIARASYDAILLDLRMPGMSGMEVYEKASRIFSAMPGRTIFMTGDVMAEELDGYLRRARLPVIPKPFDPREILEILASRLGP